VPGLTALRRFAAAKKYVSRCALCAGVLDAEHDHVVERGGARPTCCCRACGLLFSEEGDGRYRRVPRDARRLATLAVPDGLWDRLEIPVDLVFFQKPETGPVRAFYPSPAGVLESLLPLPAWRELEALHPAVAGLRPDVEALLVDRAMGRREYYVAPIDRCYELIGLIRTHWLGMTGGDEVRERTAAFFGRLRERAHAV